MLIGYASRAMLHERVVSLTFHPDTNLGYDFGHWKSPSKVNKVAGLLLWHQVKLSILHQNYEFTFYGNIYIGCGFKNWVVSRHFSNWIFKIEQGENLEFWGQESRRTLFNSIRREKQVLERVPKVSFKWSQSANR